MGGDKTITYLTDDPSDFTIYYLHTTFEVHKAVLANNCKYFAELFENDPECEELNLVPQTDPLSGRKVGSLGLFLQFIYDKQEIGNYPFFLSSETSNADEQLYTFCPDFEAMAFFAKYFQCKKVERGLALIVMKRNKVNFIWDFLFLASLYHWDITAKLIVFIAENLEVAKSGRYKEQYEYVWPKLDTAIQEQIVAIHEMNC